MASHENSDTVSVYYLTRLSPSGFFDDILETESKYKTLSIHEAGFLTVW